MRPKKLEITGFKSFIETQTVDFDRLTADSLFCISGDTGSGKTSVLDATVFALYGESGARIKKNEEFVNTACNKATIRLEIELNGKTYTVVREIRKGSAATARLYDENGITIKDKTGEVNEFIEREIGLDRKQFTKVVVLQQGAFDAFLEADKSERTALIEKLFELTLYEKAVALIRDDKVKTEEQYKAIEARLLAYEGVNKTAVSEIEKELKRLEKERLAKSKEKEELGKEADKLNAIASKYELWKKTEDNIVKTAQEIENNANGLAILQQTLAKEKENGKEFEGFDEFLESQAKLRESLIEGKVKAGELKNKESECDKLRKIYIELKSQLDGCEKRLSETGDRITRYKERYGEVDITQAEEIKARKQSEYDDASKRMSVQREKLKTLQSAQSQTVKASERVKRAEIVFDICTKGENEAKKAREIAHKAKEQAQNALEIAKTESAANAIRAGLKVGDICPVCGGIVAEGDEHRDVELGALQAGFDRAQAELEKVDKKYQDSKNAKASAVTELSGAKAALAEREEEEAEIRKSLDAGISEELVCRLGKEKLDWEDFVQLLKDYAAAGSALSVAKTSLDSTEQSGKKSRVEVDSIRAELIAKYGTDEQEILEKRISDISESAEKAKAKKVRFDSEIQKLNEAIISAKTKDEALRQSLASLKTGHTSCEKADDNAIEELKTKLKNKEDEISEISSCLGKKTNELSALRLRLEEKTAIEQERIRTGASLDELSVLANMLRARAFTDYVAEIYIAEFTLAASEWLKSLTLGHYELIYEEGEFYVMDYLSGGSKRSVKTLSGGERFLASLSLAIAISRQTSQSKDYGFFFIDEGFGSLDEKSLNTVTQALYNLAKDTVVGVITHVKDLIERIPTALSVTKSDGKSGSICSIRA